DALPGLASIFATQGKGTDARPTKFLREFMDELPFRKYWRLRPAVAVQDDLFAEEEKFALENSNVAAWLAQPPSGDFFAGLSASAIQIYEQCPLRFKLEREWNLPRDVAASLHYGKVMHAVLRTYYDARRFQREVNEPALLEMMRRGLAEAGIPDRYQYELYLRQGVEQLEQFFAAAKIAPEIEVLETEHTFEMQIGSARLRGRIDRVDRLPSGELAVVDYKTGKPKSQEEADKSLQLSLYAVAAKRVLGERAAKLIFYNLENNTAIATTRSEAELAEAEERVRDVAADIAAGKFPAKPGYQCSFCPYRNLCPATEKAVAVSRKKSAARVN